jgi:hypothetical protein
MTVSACDACPDPGACCRDFPLSGITASAHPTLLHAMVAAAAAVYCLPDGATLALGLPFIPHERDAAADKFFWHCVNLRADGRCGDYAHRPYGPCVLYQPGDDAMCAIHPEHGEN